MHSCFKPPFLKCDFLKIFQAMLNRFARVIWWLGALFLATSAYQFYDSARLSQIADQLPQLKSQIDAAWEKKETLVREYAPKDPTGKPLLSLWDRTETKPGQLLRDLHAPDEAIKQYIEIDQVAGNLHKEVESLERASRQSTDSNAFGIVFAVLTVVAWTLAYIVGGSFWSPPRSRARDAA